MSETAKLRRMEKFYRQHMTDKVHVKGRRAAEGLWRSLTLEDRQLVLEQAGWDSGGWIFRNWKELPSKLQMDFWERMNWLMENRQLPSGKVIPLDLWNAEGQAKRKPQ